MVWYDCGGRLNGNRRVRSTVTDGGGDACVSRGMSGRFVGLVGDVDPWTR